MKTIIINGLILLSCSTVFFSCKKDFGNLNSPTVESFLSNASKSDLNNLVSGTESGLRSSIAFYLDDVGIIGREMYHFSNAEPRYVTDLLGANDATLSGSNFYITTPWASAYRVVKNCNLLIQAANNSTHVSDAEKNAYYGFARTIKAYSLLLNLNLTDTIRLDVNDPDHLGPIVPHAVALRGILDLLDSGNTELSNAEVSFPLSTGFNGFSDAAGMAQFNRALAARVDAYSANWPQVLTDLSGSFFSLTADFNLGVKHAFGTGTGDQINPVFIPQNTSGEVRVAHPSFAAEAENGDDRLAKVPLRQTTISMPGTSLSSNRDVWVYTSSTAPVPIIRNEELILLYAEANIQNSNLPEGEKALNVIRNGHHLGNYSGAETAPALITEMLKQRRYSLYFEGHRWIDMRRYNLLNDLPLDRPDDNVWSKFPLPVSE